MKRRFFFTIDMGNQVTEYYGGFVFDNVDPKLVVAEALQKLRRQFPSATSIVADIEESEVIESIRDDR